MPLISPKNEKPNVKRLDRKVILLLFFLGVGSVAPLQAQLITDSDLRLKTEKRERKFFEFLRHEKRVKQPNQGQINVDLFGKDQPVVSSPPTFSRVQKKYRDFKSPALATSSTRFKNPYRDFRSEGINTRSYSPSAGLFRDFHSDKIVSYYGRRSPYRDFSSAPIAVRSKDDGSSVFRDFKSEAISTRFKGYKSGQYRDFRSPAPPSFVGGKSPFRDYRSPSIASRSFYWGNTSKPGSRYVSSGGYIPNATTDNGSIRYTIYSSWSIKRWWITHYVNPNQEISYYTGSYPLRIAIPKDSHPSSIFIHAQYRSPLMTEAWRSWSHFTSWASRGNNEQPDGVKEKNPKPKFDRKERDIWNN